MNAQINKALMKATKRSTHRRHQTGCVIVKNGEILSSGCSHASSLRMSELHSIHAEIHALGRGRHNDLRDSTAYIATMARKSGNFVFSAPCLTCAIALRTAGITEVIFSTGINSTGGDQFNNWEETQLDELIKSKGLKVYPRRK